eukprot:364282-Chlamydomonas_euryale.AAC.55
MVHEEAHVPVLYPGLHVRVLRRSVYLRRHWMHVTTAISLSIPLGFQCWKLCWKAERKHYQAGTKPIESPLLGHAAWAIMQLHVPLAAWDAWWQMGLHGADGLHGGEWG